MPIERARSFSNTKLEELRKGLAGLVTPNEIVVTCGSYARREASEESDIDFFIITERPPPAEGIPWVEVVRNAIGTIVAVAPATDGAFSSVVEKRELLRNIGGDIDSNKKITQRMLFLLEGEWLFNAPGMKEVRRQILERYIDDTMTDHQLALFLLNDIIRYYRTIAVDYEFKTVEGETPKPWAIRNLKLIFSRKLLYASGLFSIALTADRSRDKKIAILEQLFDLTATERLVHICGSTAMSPVLSSYGHFLERIEDSAVRTKLNGLKKTDRSDPLFREIKNEGHHFSQELMRLFENTFGSTHPIRRAVVF